MSDIKDIAKHLEGFGRHGDSMLVHLNPVEVDLLKSLSPTGELTTNPDTGLQEAFLPLLAGLFAPGLAGALGIPAWLAGAGLGGLASAAMGGSGKDILRDSVLGGAGSAVGGMFKGAGGTAGKVGEKMAAMDGVASGMNHVGGAAASSGPYNLANVFPDAAAKSGVGNWIAANPLKAMGGAGLAGMALSGGFGGQKNPEQMPQDNSLPAPTIGMPRNVIPLQNPLTYGIDGGEQEFFIQ